MSSGIQRKRLACIECTRRKIKCDKTLPCRNCTRKGTQCSRARARDSPGLQSTSPNISVQTSALQPQPKLEESKTISELKSQVEFLEAALREAKNTAGHPGTPMPSIDLNNTTYSPTCSLEYQPVAGSSSDSSNTSVKTRNDVEDAATILEFLAWGRRKDPSFQEVIAKRNDLVVSPGDLTIDDDWNGSHTTGFSFLSLCELLLPNKQQVHKLVAYHCDCLLWYHGSFHASTFRTELEEFYDCTSGHIEGFTVDLQWLSLLFAVLTGSIASASTTVTRAWGFRDEEKSSLSHRWLKTSISCLHQADYMTFHSVFAVQSIATLTISAHMLGKSNSFSVLLASAVRIAQGLGLHQLDGHKDSKSHDRVNQEIGRRIWCQLCIQDWFSIPYTESYLIHQKCFNTERPTNCRDDFVPLTEDIPTVTGYSRLFYSIAALMPGLYDDFGSSNTLYTRYEEVLKYDRRLRILATQHLPYYLKNVPLDPDWPCYVPWARRSLAISSAHKAIMIHRKFLSLSFVNPIFEFTRKTCVAASRTIIKEQKEATLEEGPRLWIHQAFSVTASIILCLDMCHRPTTDSEFSQHRHLVEDGIAILSRCDSDMIALRGVSLLKTMLDTNEKRRCSSNSNTDHRESGLDVASIIQTFYKELEDRGTLFMRSPDFQSQTSQSGSSGAGMFRCGDWPDMIDHEPLATVLSNSDYLMPFGVDYAEGLDDILSLATNCLN